MTMWNKWLVYLLSLANIKSISYTTNKTLLMKWSINKPHNLLKRCRSHFVPCFHMVGGREAVGRAIILHCWYSGWFLARCFSTLLQNANKLPIMIDGNGLHFLLLSLLLTTALHPCCLLLNASGTCRSSCSIISAFKVLLSCF